MRRRPIIALSVILIGSAICLAMHMRNVRLMRERAIHYQQELRSYTEEISLGATRKQVEDELQARRVQYEQWSGSDDQTNAYSDLVKIGTEPAPWYCTYNNVYIKFAFDSADPNLNKTSNADSDILRTIRITPWLGGCL
jgi:hypothetical protein